MPLLETKGAASAQGFGGAGAGASGPVTYIEDVFSTYLYTGNGSTQTITNGIDLSGKGGLVWTKSRSVSKDNGMWDTVRGVGTGSGSPNNKTISSNGLNLSAFYSTDYLSAFNADGFNVTYGSATYSVANQSGTTYAGWAFRKQPKFFDIQTWTGNGTAGKTISHNLGSVPGCIMVLCTSANYSWFVYHRSANAGGNTTSLMLNSTSAAANDGDAGIQNLTSTTFALGGAGAYSLRLNDSGQTYIAYIFAHDAGGFGLTGTDNVISCGSFTTDASGSVTVNLGYEPQWLLVKNTQLTENWVELDNMRGWSFASQQRLFPNLSNAEQSLGGNYGTPTATGFNFVNGLGNSNTYIYIAIRRGPMKVPTNGTSVFGLNARSGTGANATVTGGQLTDAIIVKNRGSAVADLTTSRLIGGDTYLVTSSTATQANAGSTVLTYPVFDVMDGFRVGSTSNITNASGETYINYLVKRAPSFFDVVCYTGTAGNLTINHNLGVVPELIIFKRRDALGAWWVWHTSFTTYPTYHLILNTNAAQATGQYLTDVISTSFSLANAITADVNASGGTYATYLFATCAGVSKVGSYTGTGALQTVNCGFTGGARFVLIKRTDSTGDWYVYDSARGISSGNDPYLFLNSTAAEVTGTNYVDTTSVGFQVTAAAPAGLNANGGTYIFLAIA